VIVHLLVSNSTTALQQELALKDVQPSCKNGMPETTAWIAVADVDV